MHKPNICILILFIISWVLLIVGFASYWYQQGTTEDGSIYRMVYYKHDGIKTCTENSCDDYTYDSDDRKYAKNTLAIFSASLAFTVLAWIVTSVTCLFVFLSLFGILAKIPMPLGTVTKILPVIALVFGLLALLIFIGVGNAFYQDCKRNEDRYSSYSNDSVCDEQKDQGYYNFVEYKDLGNDVTYVSSPSASWACVVVATGFILIGTILNFAMGKYDATPN